MVIDLQGKTAIVTGASSGIGRASSEALAEAGASVTLAARSEDELETLAEELRNEYGVEAEAVPTDVRDFDAVKALVEETVGTFGGLDVLVNNAGIGGSGAVVDLSIEEYQRMMGVNVDGVFYATKAAIPHLIDNEGHLIFIGSVAANYPRPGFPVYAATKWWTKGFALSVAGKYGEDDLGVTVINPSAVRTDFAYGDSTFGEVLDHDEAIEPREIGDLVALAASQRTPVSINSIDVYERDKLSHF